MTSQREPGPERGGAGAAAAARGFDRIETTALFVDVVESVRLIEGDEEDAVGRWLRLVAAIRARLLTGIDGRVVKSSGDGLLMEFAHARDAAATALRIRALARRRNARVGDARRLRLRFGAATGAALRTPDDLYGHCVNVAARLMQIAGPDEIVVAEATRDRLSDGIDAEIEDLGVCHLRHVSTPQRAFRVGPPGEPSLAPAPAAADLRTAVAVMPLGPRRVEPELRMLGEVVAEEAIRGLSGAPGIAAISRLSTSAAAGRGLSAAELSERLGADYLVHGSFDAGGESLRVIAELVEARSGRVVWAEVFEGPVAGLFERRGDLVAALVERIAGGIVANELEHARRAPMPTLKAYTLLLGAVTLLHRLSRRDFDFARRLLEALVDRCPRQSLPLAWLADWHVMRVNQGWSDAPDRDAWLASEAVRRALDADPGCPLAMTVDGAVKTNLLRRPDEAEASYDAAVAQDPSQPLARLLRAALMAFTDRGEAAVADAREALRLSPYDPHRFLFESISASAHLTAGDDAAALALAERSLRRNRAHASSLRVKAVAEWRLGREAEARETVAELMRLAPGFTLSTYAARSPNAGSRVGAEIVDVLRRCGAPA